VSISLWEDSIDTDFKEQRFGDWKWVELAEDRVQWWVLVLVVLNLSVLLQEC
jgi:hypothetical protein